MIEKVTAFIVRKKNDIPQLLVFKHPTAGIQIPAGTVEANETSENALLREVREETGLQRLTLLKKLGDTTLFLGQNEAVLLTTLRCFAWPAQAAKRIGPLCSRGLKLQTFERKVGFTHIKYEDYDFNQDPPTLLNAIDAWLPSDALTREILRTFYLLRVEEETQDTWQIQSDQGHTFQFFWVNWNEFPQLIGEQADWLNQLDQVTPEAF